VEDGKYLFREDSGRHWRATQVIGGVATAPWIDGEALAENLKGEWRGPLGDKDARWEEAISDPMGRLFRTTRLSKR
jgi:hypothetical protein